MTARSSSAAARPPMPVMPGSRIAKARPKAYTFVHGLRVMVHAVDDGRLVVLVRDLDEPQLEQFESEGPRVTVWSVAYRQLAGAFPLDLIVGWSPTRKWSPSGGAA